MCTQAWRPDPSTPILADDFSTDQGWIDESNGYIYRDTTNQWLEWNVTRAEARRWIYPINAASDNIHLSARFRVTDYGGNGAVFISLVEQLGTLAQNAQWYEPGVWLTGQFDDIIVNGTAGDG